MELWLPLSDSFDYMWGCFEQMLFMVIPVASGFNFTQSWTVRDDVIPFFISMHEDVSFGYREPNPFRRLSMIVRCFGLTLYLGLDCLSLMILNGTVWYFVYMSRACSLAPFTLLCLGSYGELRCGLRIPFNILFILILDGSVEARWLWFAKA